MSEQSLTDLTNTYPAQQPPALDDDTSIVDTILNLDELMSADVRRAQDEHRFYVRGDLLAKIHTLKDRIDLLTDAFGNPIEGERGLDTESVASLREQRAEYLREYVASALVVKLEQMQSDDWEAFNTKWKRELAAADRGEVLPQQFWNQLIVETVVEPKLTQTAVLKLRQTFGAPPVDALGQRCWRLNSQGGVSVPK